MAIQRFELVREDTIREDSEGVLTIDRRYIIQMSDNVAVREQVSYARPDLVRFQPHPDHPHARVVAVELKQRKHTRIWDLGIQWSSAPPPEKPTDEPAEVEWATTEVTEAVTHDPNTRRANLNTAGQLLEDISETYGLWEATVTKNVLAIPAWFEDYSRCINSDAVRIDGKVWAPKTLKLMAVRISKYVRTADPQYRTLTMRLLYNKKGWTRTFLNRGLMEVTLKVDREGRVRKCLEPITTDDGQRVNEPQFLDKDGRRPRLDESGRPLTLQREIDLLQAGQPVVSSLKWPLDPDDIITVKRETLPILPFGRLPLR